MNIGLQLYSLRGAFEKNPVQTLEQVAKAGYDSVEFYSFQEMDAPTIRKILDTLGLVSVGAHTQVAVLENNLDWAIEYNATLGSSYIICPWAGYQSRADIVRIIDMLNRCGEACAKAGLKMAYHNHAHEFKKIGGKMILQWLMEYTDPVLVDFELDTCFIAMAGLDPAAYIQEHKERCSLVHLKEYLPGYRSGVAEIGNGEIDFAQTLQTCKNLHINNLIVEQEFYTYSAIESMKNNISSLKKIATHL